METNYIFIKDNTSSRKKLWDSQQRTISDSESLSQMKAIPLECYWKVQSLDLPQKSQVFLEKTNTRADILSRKDQVDMMEDNKNIKMLKRQTMEKKNEHRSWSSNVKRKLDSRRNHTIERNLKE